MNLSQLVLLNTQQTEFSERKQQLLENYFAYKKIIQMHLFIFYFSGWSCIEQFKYFAEAICCVLQCEEQWCEAGQIYTQTPAFNKQFTRDPETKITCVFPHEEIAYASP